ncbi:MAG: DUF480 domain-containing protein [Acidimicrobiales bacterium]|nr:DUF480 domain-containing protein [Acidimicrobiales bacterium]
MSDEPHDEGPSVPRLSGVACRVLGSLMEKELTVPSTYPMTLNGLVTACNQASGRNPVMTLTDAEVLAALDELRALGLTRVVHASHGARTSKYRQVAHEVLRLEPPERAVVTLLLLRGAQTPGELRTRSDRLHKFESVDEVARSLADLAGRPGALVEELARQPGQKEARWVHLLADAAASVGSEAPLSAPAASAPAAPPPPVALHPALEPLKGFVGRWEGAGAGEYPTIEPYAYVEVVELVPVPDKPLLSYRSSTRHAESGIALHAESGWLRPVGGDSVELVVAQAPGLVEVCEGFFEAAGAGGELLLESSLVAGTATAKEVTATERRYRVTGDRLEYEIAMAAVGQPLTHHLRALLHRNDQ